MKFTIARSELVEALSVASKGTSSRSTLPILSGVLLSCQDGTLTLQTTDLEVSVKHTTPALVDTEGATVLPARLFTDIVRSLPEAAVSVETDGGSAHIRCQQSSFSIKTLPSADFPAFPEVAGGHSTSLPASALATMIKKVGRAVSRDETRAVLTGVLLVVEGATIRMVATDSYRLAIDEVMLEEPTGDQLEVIVPGRALDEAIKMASATGEESVRLGVSENQIVFEFGRTTFVTRRIEGTFPNYRQLIPKPSDEDTVLTASTEEIIAAVKRVSVLAMQSTPIRLTVSVEDQTLSLSARTQDVGDASEDVMVKAQGNDMEIAFNHTYLSDGLTAVTTDTVQLRFVSPLKPGVIRSTEGEDFTYLLMPVRLS